MTLTSRTIRSTQDFRQQNKAWDPYKTPYSSTTEDNIDAVEKAAKQNNLSGNSSALLYGTVRQ
ncbi:hypothetical protein DPV78_002484 [Talaromyces pinophilus]|nr:hypothetical protein DPV78_002484 [Talaromyces pinophilus]